MVHVQVESHNNTHHRGEIIKHSIVRLGLDVTNSEEGGRGTTFCGAGSRWRYVTILGQVRKWHPRDVDRGGGCGWNGIECIECAHHVQLMAVSFNSRPAD